MNRLPLKGGAALVLSLLMSGGLGLSARAEWGRTVYVNTPQGYALNLRWGPGKNFGIYQKVLRGTSLQTTGVRRYGWVQLTNGTWVAGNLVSSRPVQGHGGSLPGGNIAYVVTPPNFALNIRSGPGTNYPVVGQFLNGTQVRLTGRYSVGWAQLVGGNWVDNGFLRTTYPDNTRPVQPPTQPTYDPNVTNLQRRLIQLGYLPANFVPNGIYDAATQQAVREFQRINGLPVNGIVDDATWRALYEATAPNPMPTVSPTPTVSPFSTPTPSPTLPPIGGGQQMRVATDGQGALVFRDADPTSEILRTLPDGTTVTTTGRVNGNWTELTGGGWVFTLDLQPM